MAYRWRGKYFEVDEDNPRAEGICDRCGLRFNLDRLQWQYSYQGTVSPQNIRFLVCFKCLDPLNPQDQPYILPPDPLPVYNARPENYTLDETSWMSTQAGDDITTQSGANIISSPVPINPDTAGNTSYLACELSVSGTISVAYLDLFNGDPNAGGTSVLSAITGSSTRTNVYASLQENGQNVLLNPDVITVAAESESTVNVNYVGFYSASISGALLVSGPISASPTIADGNVVQFNALALSIAQV